MCSPEPFRAMGGPEGWTRRLPEPIRPQRQRRTGAEGLFVRASAREEATLAAGEISPAAMVSGGRRPSQVLARKASGRAAIA